MLDLEKIVVAPASGERDDLVQNVIPDGPLIEGPNSVGYGPEYLSISLVADATEPEVLALIERLDSREDIQWANPYVFRGLPGGNVVWPTGNARFQYAVRDIVMIVFSDSSTEAEIEALFSEYALESATSVQTNYGREVYTMRLTKRTPLPTLELANALHEDRRTLAAYPDLLPGAIAK